MSHVFITHTMSLEFFQEMLTELKAFSGPADLTDTKIRKMITIIENFEQQYRILTFEHLRFVDVKKIKLIGVTNDLDTMMVKVFKFNPFTSSHVCYIIWSMIMSHYLGDKLRIYQLSYGNIIRLGTTIIASFQLDALSQYFDTSVEDLTEFDDTIVQCVHDINTEINDTLIDGQFKEYSEQCQQYKDIREKIGKLQKQRKYVSSVLFSRLIKSNVRDLADDSGWSQVISKAISGDSDIMTMAILIAYTTSHVQRMITILERELIDNGELPEYMFFLECIYDMDKYSGALKTVSCERYEALCDLFNIILKTNFMDDKLFITNMEVIEEKCSQSNNISDNWNKIIMRTTSSKKKLINWGDDHSAKVFPTLDKMTNNYKYDVLFHNVIMVLAFCYVKDSNLTLFSYHDILLWDDIQTHQSEIRENLLAFKVILRNNRYLTYQSIVNFLETMMIYGKSNNAFLDIPSLRVIPVVRSGMGEFDNTMDKEFKQVKNLISRNTDCLWLRHWIAGMINECEYNNFKPKTYVNMLEVNDRLNKYDLNYSLSDDNNKWCIIRWVANVLAEHSLSIKVYESPFFEVKKIVNMSMKDELVELMQIKRFYKIVGDFCDTILQLRTVIKTCQQFGICTTQTTSNGEYELCIEFSHMPRGNKIVKIEQIISMLLSKRSTSLEYLLMLMSINNNELAKSYCNKSMLDGSMIQYESCCNFVKWHAKTPLVKKLVAFDTINVSIMIDMLRGSDCDTYMLNSMLSVQRWFLKRPYNIYAGTGHDSGGAESYDFTTNKI